MALAPEEAYDATVPFDQSSIGDVTRSSNGNAAAVWLIEDDVVFRDTVQRLLNESEGVRCDWSFGSCEEALDVLEKGLAPDVVLIDIGLPGMSGIEGIPRIRAISPTSVLIVLTVHEDDEKVFEAICAGASGYLLKPSSPKDIVSAVLVARDGGAPINPHIAGRVLDMFSRLAVPKADYGLTEREHEVLEFLVEGYTKQRIANEIFLSPHTVDVYIRNIYAKLHVHSRSGAIAKALRERLI
jgi:DNA-binding NarL/FixJ family response regulator